MNLNVFKQQIKTLISPVYVFLGQDDKTKTDGLEIIRRQLATNNIRRMDSSIPSSDILTELNSEDLFSDKKIILLNRAEEFKPADLKYILDYEKSGSTSLVIFCAWKAPLKKLFESLKIPVIDCYKPFASKLAADIRERFKKEGKSIDNPAISSLIEISRSNSSDIEMNIDKLLNFRSDEQIISMEDVKRISTSREQESVFEFAWEIIENNSTSSILKKAAHFKPSDEIGIMGFLRGLFEKLLVLKEKLKNNNSIGEYDAKSLQIYNKTQAAAAVRFVKKTPEAVIVECYKEILETFEKYKSGQTGAFQNALVTISGLLGKGGKA